MSDHILKFGIHLPTGGPMADPEQLTAIAQHAEKLGFHAIAVSDHIIIPSKIRARYPYSRTGTVEFIGECLEQLTTLSFLAAKTSRINLMTSIMVLPYRNPLLAAKILSTIDVLSKGRLIVGVGVGWMKEEFEVLKTPPFEERGGVAEEFIRIFREVWTKESPKFSGKYCSFPEIQFLPKPYQKPHPPIWVGGESLTAMKRAARYGDGWYPTPNNPSFPLKKFEHLETRLREFRKYVRRAGRDPDQVKIGIGDIKHKPLRSPREDILFVGNYDKILSDIMKCEKLGVSYLSFSLRGRDLGETMSNMNVFSEEIIRKVG